MDWKVLVAVAGWGPAIVQFAFTHREVRNRNEADLLEKTLNYFGKGPQQRSIGISLTEGIWLKQKKNLDIILPVLVSQASFLLTAAEKPEAEERNLIRILHLIHQCLPHAENGQIEVAEISQALMMGATFETGVNLTNTALKYWYVKYNSGGADSWEAEIEHS